MPTTKQLRSEAALRDAIEAGPSIENADMTYHWSKAGKKRTDLVIILKDYAGTPIAEVSLKEVISKRKSLRGINKAMQRTIRSVGKRKAK